MTLVIWGDNVVEALWFRDLDGRLAACDIRILGARGTNPPAIDDLLRYDRPDVILANGDQPVLVLEKTREVPTGHNVGQRVARLVRAVEDRIPTIKFFPFDARKHGLYSGMCYLNIRLLAAFMRMTEIHDVPMLAMDWPIDSHGELIIDGSENKELSGLVGTFLDSGMKRWWPGARRVLTEMDSEYGRRLLLRLMYGQPPASARIVETDVYLTTVSARLGADAPAIAALLNRAETLVYRIAMTPEKARREDPYTGTQFIYDYNECRSGAAVDEKTRNLVLDFPNITKTQWAILNPNDPRRKSSNWYVTANALVFADGAQMLRVSR